MKKKLIISICIICFLCLCIPFCILIFREDKQKSPSPSKDYEYLANIGIGGGGAFFTPMINPKDSSNYLVTCDMGGLYYSLNKGKTWNRTESKGVLTEAHISNNGTIFAGGYGLYASYDKGKTLELIYPKEVQYSVSRCGWNENLMLAEDFNNGYLRCVISNDNNIFFSTIDWEGNARILTSNYYGENLKTLYEEKLSISNPHDIDVHMVNKNNTLYFTFGNNIRCINLEDNQVSTIYTATGIIKDLKIIGNNFFFIDDTTEQSQIIYTQDFVTLNDLMDFNNLPKTFTKWGRNGTFNWHFKEISGNNFENIFLSFSSPVNEFNNEVDGIMKFNGENFEWVFDSMYKNRDTISNEDWSYGSHGPFYGITCNPHDDNMCLVSNIESVYVMNYKDQENRSVYTNHTLVTKKNGKTSYSTTGLNVQTTYSVKEDPFNSKHIIICTTDMGLQNSYDNGKTWNRMEITGDNYDIYNTCYDLYFDTQVKDKVYALWSSRHDAPYSPSIYDKDYTMGAFGISLDGGNTWDFSYSQGIPEDAIPVKMSVKKIDNTLTFLVATFNRGFYISKDNGRNFESLNTDIVTHEGLIHGEDVVLTDTKVYLLTAPYIHENSWVASNLYEYDLTTQTIKDINLGDIVIARSLTYDKEKGLFINVIPTYHYEWMSEFDNGLWVNDNGGIYHYDGENVSLYFSNNDGIFNSGFNKDGTMFAIDTYGKVFVCKNGKFKLMISGLFNMLKNVSFSSNGKILYVTTFGGGTYKIDIKHYLDKIKF